MVGAILAIAAGVTIGAGIIGVICDELSESEKEKQAEMQDAYRAHEQAREKELQKIKENKEKILANKNEEYQKAARKQRDQHQETMKQMWEELVALYRCSAKVRIAEKRALLRELTATIKLLSKSKKSQNTMLRKNALEQLMRELEEAKEKLTAYIIYLEKYEKNLKGFTTIEVEPPEPFEFMLPSKFLYQGKLVFWKKSELQEKGEVAIRGIKPLKYCFREFDFLQEYGEEAVIPLLAGEFHRDTYEIELSAKKGIFKNTVIHNPRIGIRAEVVRYSDRGDIELNYNDSITLRLPKRNLENPKRTPPMGASLRVFPMKWDSALNGRIVEVSERASDSLLNYDFEDIPVVFTEAGWEEFEPYLEENELAESMSEWKIAPYEETEIPNVTKVKLQLGTVLVFLANIRFAGKRAFFVYERLLDESRMVKPEDIFVPMDCTLNGVLESEIDQLEESIYQNMANLSMMVFSEFKLQYQTKLSQNGMQYFNKWSEVTDKLITYLYKGSSVEAAVEKVKKEEYDPKIGGMAYRVYFLNPREMLRFVDKVYAKTPNSRMVEFFIEVGQGEYVTAEFSPDCAFMRVYGKQLDDFFEQPPAFLRIFQKNFCYAEYQQSAALHAFRVGKLANPYLQVCALDSSNIVQELQPFDIKDYFNKRLPEDLSQKQAVERALFEKNIFLIQGPPGTGKTTVIREIIQQYVAKSNFSKILVVSQANVAVDNVLKGLLADLPKMLVRCGKADKIDDVIQEISFEHKYQSYIERISRKQKEHPRDEVLERWMQLVAPENGYNPDIGELIIKGHRIIGATCVGLAKKRIGLDRMDFDLVIIDEAGKALPAEVLIPFVKAKKVILIGDHKQLPPTVHTALLDESKIELEDRDVYEDRLFYESFFYRMFEHAPDTNKCMLSTQYRMPEVLGSLISTLFYQGKIVNGAGTTQKEPFYFSSNLNLLDMSRDRSYQEDDRNSIAVINKREAEVVCQLVGAIRKKVAADRARIAIITPYKGQKREIIRKMLECTSDSVRSNVDINTVDAFQGDEAEIVIFCMTRAVKPTNYFSDDKRLNVALSRAKNELIIVGSEKYFYKYKQQKSVLPKIADYIKQHGKRIRPEEIESDFVMKQEK